MPHSLTEFKGQAGQEIFKTMNLVALDFRFDLRLTKVLNVYVNSRASQRSVFKELCHDATE